MGKLSKLGSIGQFFKMVKGGDFSCQPRLNLVVLDYMDKELPKIYTPKDYEDKIYQAWEKSGLFNPDVCVAEGVCKKNAPTFSVVLPPPNITDKLHLGHMVMVAITDILVRYHRMNGHRTLWVPGTDHAAIATQNVVEKKLWQEEKKTRHDLGREKFLTEVWRFVKETQATIIHQLKKTGASLDWSREAFTLDEARQEAVKRMFIEMYNEGVIYRGYRIVNWCPRCQSTLADDEVEYKEQDAALYTFRYSKDFPLAISTTRPETKLGDTAVAVNPEDERYKKYVGKVYAVDFCGVPLKLKIIADSNVDPNFGTGALGVTPAHSMVDYAMAQKHKLEIKKVINEEGKIIDAGKFSGLAVMEAREQVVKELIAGGLLEKEENIKNNLSVCYRCGTGIEPLPSKQWFVSVDKKLKRLGGKSLKEKAIEVVKSGKIKFVPERFTKRYLDWMADLHDWCVSRQIWFGHRIPVWYRRGYEGEITKEMGFYRDVAPQVIVGKTKTYRLRDHGFKKGDAVMFRNSQTDEIFGTAEIIDITKTTVGQIPLHDHEHGAIYERPEQLIAAFQRHNPQMPVTADTEAFIYTYKFTPIKTEENEKTQISITYYVHGTTIDNEAGKSSGHYDVVLSKLGVKQSRELKETVKNKEYDVVFCSDLTRAVDTATIAFGDKAVIIQDRRLREIDYGDLTRADEEEVRKRKKDAIEQPFPNGESYRDVGQRVSDFLCDVAVKYSGKKIAIVAHQAPQLALEVLLNGKTWGQAFAQDWRNTKSWQPGWNYALPALICVGDEKPGKGWIQDIDSLDTWFSSGMWTFSTLGWPNKTKDLKTYHPTQVLETGYEIITLWVSRMIMMSLFALGEIPFENVYLHGMVLDAQGKKMSKSKGNGIDPLEMIQKYGTDATRMSLVVGNTPGNDTRMSEQKIADFRNFANKLWNIARYIISNYELRITNLKINKENLTLADRWILSKINNLVTEVTEDIDNFNFSQAGERLRDFTWNDLADWYIEASKFEKNNQKSVILNLALENLLKLWHPFMPFVTEAIWQDLGHKELLMVAQWPKKDAMYNFEVSVQFELVIDVIKTIRNLRSEYKLPPAQKVKAIIYAGKNVELLQSQAELIKNLRTGAGELEIKQSGDKLKQAAWAAVDKIEIYIPLAGLIDIKKEQARMEKRAQELNKLISDLEAKLDNETFVKRAPKEIVEAEIKKLENYRSEHKQLKEQMKHLKT